MLIDQNWCDFFIRHDVRVGVSLDGPQHIHDANRVDRAGRGTFERVMRGISLLQQNGIDPSIIAVVTRAALSYPEEIWNFFANLGIKVLGFNAEEAEGSNINSSLYEVTDISRYKEFFRRLLDCAAAHPSSIALRELENIIRHLEQNSSHTRTQDNVPMAILNFDWQGNISTFSPEMLTVRNPHYGDFVFGNVYEHSMEDLLLSEKFVAINNEIQRGVDRCRRTCDYFSFCGGGCPSNKLTETGSLDATETQACRLRIKATTSAIFEHLEAVYQLT